MPLVPSPRLAEVMGALSIATDLGMGQPMEFALRGCVVSMRLADALGLSDADLHAVYYFSLLRYIGCNADMHLVSAILGDELAFRWDAGLIDAEDPAQVRALIERCVRLLHVGVSPSRMAGALAVALKAFAELSREIHIGHCEVGERLAQQMGFGAPMIHALGQAYERWDGTGPREIKSDALAPAVSVVSLIQDALVFHQVSGVEAAVHVARERSGTVYAPRHVETFCARASKLFAGLETEPVWNLALACEPGARVTLADARLDAACEAMADFADLKSPYLLGHSRGVARLAADAARRFGLPQNEIQKIRRAGWLQDIGRAGISAGIWSKAGALSVDEWEKVRLHSYFGERVLARSSALAQLGALASLHHERVDGSGYFRGIGAALLSPSARILAAADVYQAMLEPRPYRPARAPHLAAAELEREARAGRLDRDAVNAVLAAAGQTTRSPRINKIGGLTTRELEVLQLIARGQTIPNVADALTISKKTAETHVTHIYSKIGVTTRAAATLFAMQNNLL